MTTSAFGVEHGEIEKGLKDAAQTARLHGKTVTGGFKLARLHNKKALSDAGYPTKVGANMKESFQAGMRGQGKTYARGRKYAVQAGRARTQADIADISQGKKAGKRMIDPGMAASGNAKFNRGMSRNDFRLK